MTLEHLLAKALALGLDVSILWRPGDQPITTILMQENREKLWADGTKGGVSTEVGRGIGHTYREALQRALALLERGG